MNSLTQLLWGGHWRVDRSSSSIAMAEKNQYRDGILVLAGIALLFLIGRLFGSAIFYNNWSFVPWSTLPIWWPITWSVVALALTYIVIKRPDSFESLVGTPRRIMASILILFGLLVIFHVDSFVWAGGNLRVAQIAQSLRIIPPWFEYGTITIVGGLFSLGKLIGLESNTAGVMAWRFLSYACTILSLIAAVKLSGLLSEDGIQRLWLAVLLFFGPQFLVAFGYIGVEPVLVAVTLWFATTAITSIRSRDFGKLALMWGVVLLGIALHISAACLVPAAVFVTLRHLRMRSSLATTVALLLLAGGVAYVYGRASNDFALAHHFLFIAGKSPFPRYGLFSTQHLGDVLQILFVTAPLMFLGLYLRVSRRRLSTGSDTGIAAGLMALAGVTLVFIADPINSVVLDLPRLAAYLTPVAVFTAVVLSYGKKDSSPSRMRLLRLAAIVSVLVPMSYLPSLLCIAETEKWAEAHFDKYPWFYRDGSFAFRDASFHTGDFDRANSWEQGMTSRSSEVINMRGVQDLIMSDRYSEAINILHQIKAYDPYWLEPRDVLARLYMALGRHQQAVPEIDTVMMIAPHRREGWRDRYQYYRDTKNYAAAVRIADQALEVFPGDVDFRVDQMLSRHLVGAYREADSLATRLNAEDVSNPFPYLVKGMYADGRGDAATALGHYRRFLELAPDEPEAQQIRSRVAELSAP